MRTLAVSILVLSGYIAAAQTFTETIRRELTFEKPSPENALMIANINGNVTVTAYEGTKVVVEVKKTINAKTDARLETGKSEVQLAVIDRADTLILYITDGCHQFRKGTNNHSGWQFSGWSYQSDSPRNCHLTYDFKTDFTVKVPAGLNVLASTINAGDVVVESLTGVVKATNINGSIRLSDLTNPSEAHSINGNVDIEYTSNPPGGCRFYTLNGNINALFQPGLSANLSFDSFNGSFYTNLESIETLPAQVQTSGRGDGLRYKISGNRFRIRNGGPLLDFETFNGNVYLKEK